MSKILLIGATGFIGQTIHKLLELNGHEVIRGIRHPQSPKDFAIDYSQLCKNRNLPFEIPEVEVVINAVGIIEESKTQTFEELHYLGPKLFFEACYKKGIRKFIQIMKYFISFFFLQRERYFLPLIDKIFDCIYNGDEDLKAHSIAMLEFLMERAGDINEKLNYIETTIERTIFLLRKISMILRL